jgi:hypothetical protein
MLCNPQKTCRNSPRRTSPAWKAADNSAAIHGWLDWARSEASPSRDDRMPPPYLLSFLLVAFAHESPGWGEIPARRPRGRPDNGLLLDVPGIPDSKLDGAQLNGRNSSTSRQYGTRPSVSRRSRKPAGPPQTITHTDAGCIAACRPPIRSTW